MLVGPILADADPVSRRIPIRSCRETWLASGSRSASLATPSGVVDGIGADHIHGNVHRAVEAQLAEEDDVKTT
jgi:hypothetical protein